MKQSIYSLVITFCVLVFCNMTCNSIDTENSKEQTTETDSISNNMKTLSSKKEIEKTIITPISSEKVEKQVAEVMEEPEQVVDPKTKLRAEDLVIKKQYDVHSLTDALNQLKPSLSEKARIPVMNTIQMDFSDTKRQGVVTGTFVGEAFDSYSIRSYMNRLTMVGPYKIRVKKLSRDSLGKIISITLEEIENFNL